MKHIKLVQLDGKLPNLALMRLAHWHRSQGDSVRLTRSVQPTLFDQEGSTSSTARPSSPTPSPRSGNSRWCTPKSSWEEPAAERT